MSLLLLRRGLMGFALVTPLIGSGCSSDELRDQNYGTDAAAGYTGPEAGFAEAGTTQGVTDAEVSDEETDSSSPTDTNVEDSAKDTAEATDATLDAGTEPLPT